MSVSRRSFLKKVGCLTAGVGALGFLPEVAHASAGNGTKVLFINFNGGWDGLAVVPPLNTTVSNTLKSLRPTLALDPSVALALDSNYGLNANLANILSLHNEGKVATILNVGYQNMSRSHLDSEVAVARGVLDRLGSTSGGFISRMGTTYGWNPLQAVCVSGTDRSFSGSTYSGVQTSGLSGYQYENDNSQSYHERDHRVDTMYAVSQVWSKDSNKAKQGAILDSISNAANTTDAIHDAVGSATYPTSYPSTQIGRQLKDVDVLFSTSSLNTEIAYTRRIGFDTHATQQSRLDAILVEFNTALGIFVNNMKAKGLWNNLIIMVLSEFGRTSAENGSQGTDHGGACPVMLIGGGVKGGVYGNITSSDLTGYGWLQMKINMVEVYRQVVAKMGYDPDLVFEKISSPVLPALF